MSALAGFLLARIAEDDDLAFTPRQAAEVDAKRRVVQIHAVLDDGYCFEDGSRDPCPTLRLLAIPYDDHPDYDEAWRP